jgi:uncharacterized RDD family membrane protein YckC
MAEDNPEHAGFWIRVGASLIDTLLLLAITMPLLYAIYGKAYFEPEEVELAAGMADFLLTWVAPAVAAIAFWIYRQATPGKMMLGLKVVDAKTGNTLRPSQAVIRYIGYYVATIPLGIGLIWVALDERKQGWHDKMAGTIVLRVPKQSHST